MTRDPRLRGDPPRDPRRRESPAHSSPLSSPHSIKRARTDSDVEGAKGSSAAPCSRSAHVSKQTSRDKHQYEPSAKRNASPASPDSAKSPPSRPSAHNSLDFQQASNTIAKRAIVPASPTGPTLLKPFTKAEDDVIMQGVVLYGSRWPQIAAYFWKKAPQNPRSQESLRTRYRKHLDKRPKDGQDAEQAHKSKAASQSLTSGSASSSSPSSSFSTPPLPKLRAATPHPVTPQASTRTVIAGKVWPKEEEAQLLCIALKHQSVTDILAQVAAVFKDFRSAFPSKTRSSEAVHIKYRQLLQSVQKKEEEEEREEGEIVEGKSEEKDVLAEAEEEEEGQKHEEVVAEQDASADLTMVEEEIAQDVTMAANSYRLAAVSEKHKQGENTSQSNPSTTSTGEGSVATQPQTDAAAPTSAGRPRSPRTPEGTPPAQPQGSNIVQPTAPVLPAIDFDFDVDHLTYGLRFSRLPRNCELSISSATRYKLRSLSPDQQPPPGAAFVFHILANGATQGLVLPPGTKTQVVVVPAADDDGVGGARGEGGGGVGGVVTGRFVAETHFESPVDKFLVVFASPL